MIGIKNHRLEISIFVVIAAIVLCGLFYYNPQDNRIHEDKGKVLEIDGFNNFVIDINGEEERVFLNSVEADGHDKDTATQYVKKIASGKDVTIEYDKSPTLQHTIPVKCAYIYLPSGEMINMELIKNGYAYYQQTDDNTRYKAEFENAQKNAQYERLGIWSDSTNIKKTNNTNHK